MHQVFAIANVDGTTIGEAIASGNPDFEDAVQISAGRHAGATHIVTRDPKGFSSSGLVVVSPQQLMLMIRTAPAP